MKRILTIALFVAVGICSSFSQQIFTENTLKLARTLAIIDAYYVDSTNQSLLTEKAIREVLRNLDPHSVYFSPEEVKEIREGLDGNFEGIGIQFNILYDTVIVISPVPGGPSEKVGIRAGDRIVTIEGEKVAGKGITTTGVRKRLLGEKGTKVRVGIFHRGAKGITDYTITRDKIPVNSLDAQYMLNDETGYIKLNKFAATTEAEFVGAVNKLLGEDMKHLVIDLRGNSGGYLEAAIRLSDHLFSEKKLVVYLKGLKTPRQDFYTRGDGRLSGSRIIILVDEGSASASEILAGAVQDWDRGIIIGRRTFGKGLVQNGFNMQDGSELRLTIARYYTPTGRLIQRPYDEGIEKYVLDFYSRFSNGELMTADSISFPDSLRFRTLANGRDVFGGGGIMPDLFVGIDTSWYSQYYRQLLNSNVITEYTLDYVDKNRKELVKKYKNFDDFSGSFYFDDVEKEEFIKKASSMGVEFKEEEYNKSSGQLFKVMKGLVARDIWDMSEYYETVNTDDEMLLKALDIISDEEKFNSLLRGNR